MSSHGMAMRTLNARLVAQRAEYATCKTAAERNCLKQAMADTRRQMRELIVSASREGAAK